ncbi:MAG: crossover junction endodeoxyribonuclease RuvC [Candidatus Omnitrophota bacterium]
MRILGIDPGLVRTGYGLIEAAGPDKIIFLEAGVIKTKEADGISKRVKSIYENLTDIVKEYKPAVLVLEKIYSHCKHPVTSILMGHARGIVCLVCGINKIQLASYPSTRIKKAITGNGRAGKGQIQRMVKSFLNLKELPEPFDASDALAMAISYVYIEGVKK